MIASTATPTSFVISPTVEIQPAANPLPQVDLNHVAYYRDETSYEDLLRALQQKVSVLQKQLATIIDR
jgi:hypothetical protein